MKPITQDLTIFLRQTLGSTVSISAPLRQLKGGFDTDTYSFNIENGPADMPNELVLRLFRKNEAHRVGTESTVQNAINTEIDLVPRVPIDSAGHRVDGRPFIVMEYLPGTNLGAQIGNPEILAAIPKLLATQQVNLHRVDSLGVRGDLSSLNTNFERLAPQAMLNRISSMAQTTRHTGLINIDRWLNDNRPHPPSKPTICHGDFHANNILFDHGKVTGIIDWGNITFTHAEFDVAVTHLIMSVGPLTMQGDPDQLDELIKKITSEYLDCYRAIRPLDDSLLAYYGALRAAHAYAKVVAANHGCGVQFAGHDGYSWKHPVLFTAIGQILEQITGVRADEE